MSEELLQRGLHKTPEKIGQWDFYNIGSTTIKALKEYGIIRNLDYGNIEKKKVDAIIVQQKNVIAIIEYKKPTQFKTKEQKDKAIQQEIEVARKIGAKIIIATDTQESIWVNALTGIEIKDEYGKEIKTIFDPKDEGIVNLIEKINYSINEITNNLKPIQFVNPTDLAKSIWQDIWSVSGATPENCLYTFVEVFIFKYLSDLGVLKDYYSFNHLIEGFETNTSEEILDLYASSIRLKIKELFPFSPIDNTTIINGTIFVSKDQKAVKGYSTVFKKVLLKFHDYGKLENIDYDFKSKLFESFLKESISKKNWGQFFTPLKVVRAITKMAKDEIKDGIKICDPACGVGKFLLEPIVTKLDNFYEIDGKVIHPKITIRGFDKGFDKDEQKTIILAKANMLIYFSDLIKNNPGLCPQFAKLFNESFTLKTNSILGTLSETVENEYDLILTNPPYVTSGSSNLKDEIKKDGELIDHYKINALGVEGLFMEWIIRALKPNGKAFIVVPDGIFNRQNDKNLRKFLTDECYIDGIISLPLKTFFTTPKKTYILCITKKDDKRDVQTDPIFTYLVSEIGESRDVYRFDISQDDLTEAVTLYSFFKGNKQEFAKINTDKRCKMQPIQKFKPDNHWSIDRWWTKEEQIELGILEEDNVVSVNEFGELVNDISESLNEFSELIKEIGNKKKTKTEFKDVSLGDKRYFELFIGKRILKKDLLDLKGDIPIYSANVLNPVGFHICSNILNFDNNFVTWGIDGDFEFNFIKNNNPFVTTDHCGTIRILYNDILPEYLMLQLSKVKHKYGFDRGLRSSLKNMKSVSIQIPIDKHGEIDVKVQKEVMEKHHIIKETKKKVDDYKNKIYELNVDLQNVNIGYKIFKIKDIFDLSNKTNNSKFTKTFINNHKGDIPVYSASKFSDAPDYGYVKDNLKEIKYFENCLTWNIDGSIGRAHYRKGRFSLSEKVIPLIIKDELQDKLSIEFLKYCIECEFGKHSFGFGNKAGKGKIQNIEILIPMDKNEFDLGVQKQIAEKYRKIECIKNTIVGELEKIQESVIEIE